MQVQKADDIIQNVRSFFETHYTAPANQHQIDQDLRNMLESPVFKHYVFSNNIVCVIDHSIGGYRYFSDSVYEVMGIAASEFMAKGLTLSVGLMVSQDVAFLMPIFEKVSSLIQSVPKEDRMFARFNYCMRYNSPKGERLLYQQNIPIAFNEAGLPYLMLALLSDITSYSKGNGVHYRLSLAKPGGTVHVLLEGHTGQDSSPLTSREREITLHLAEGLDANEIAERLFISEGTVRAHRKNILEKTGARNSVHLVRMAVANGWI